MQCCLKQKEADMSRRSIVVDGITWRYRVGRVFVVAKSETGTRKTAHAAAVVGVTPDEFDRAKWKGSMLCAVTPSHVAAWLRT